MTEKHFLDRKHLIVISVVILISIFVLSVLTASGVNRKQQAPEPKYYRYGKVCLKVTKNGANWLQNVVSLDHGSTAPAWSTANSSGVSYKVSQTNSTTLALASTSNWGTAKSYSIANNRIPDGGASNSTTNHLYMANRQFNLTVPKGYKYGSQSQNVDDAYSWLAQASVPDAIASASTSDRSSNIILHLSAVFTGVRTMQNSAGTNYRYVLSGGNSSSNNITSYNTITVNLVPHNYSITYNLNGGTHGSNHPTSYNVETNTFSISNPTRTGYTFSGWSGSYTGKNVSIAKGTVGNKTLTANWQPNTYTINYAGMNNASFGTNHPTSGTFNSSFNVDNPTKTGYTFTGWKITGMDSTTHTYGSSTTTSNTINTTKATTFENLRSTSGTVTFTAQWEAHTGTIEFNSNGGDGYMDDQEYIYDTTETIDKCEYSNEGHRFKEWNTEPNGSGTSYADEQNIKTAFPDGCDLKLYAQWENTDAIIHFNGNGNTSGLMNDQIFSLDENTKLNKNKYTKTNSVFNGWNTKADGSGTTYSDEQEILIHTTDNNELTLYAQWTTGKFSLSGDTRVVGYQFNWVNTENGTLRVPVTLLHDTMFTIFDLDKNAEYQISEDGTRNYTPSYSVSDGKELIDKTDREKEGEKGQSLETPENSKLPGNLTYDFTNERSVSGSDLTIQKKVTGDLVTSADKTRVFTFSYNITGLDPRKTYPMYTHISGRTPEEDVETPLTPTTSLSPGDSGYESSGVLTGEIGLKHTDYATIGEIPEGAKYNITEKTNVNLISNWPYKSSYEVIEGAKDDDGNSLINSESSVGITSLPNGGNTAYGLSINQNGEHNAQGLGVETMPDNAVTYLFRNSKADPHNITVKKQVNIDGNENIELNEDFDFVMSFSNLAPNTQYTASNPAYNFTSDSNGKANVNMTLRGRQQITFANIPGDAEYEIKESESSYIANVKIMTGADILYETTGMYGQGVSVNNQEIIPAENDSEEEIGLNADQTILFSNTKNTKNRLVISKEAEGKGVKATDEFNFSVQFTGISVENHQIEKQTLDEDGDVVSSTSSVYSPSSENNTYTFTLKSDQRIIINGIPNTATYKVTESASDGYTPSYQFIEGEAEKPEDDAEENTALSTETENLPTNAEVAFTNVKDTPPPEKTVSDDDNKTWDGEGTEHDVTENTVPNKSSEWEYKITQKVYPGHETFEFIDKLPKNVILRGTNNNEGEDEEFDYSGDVIIKWIKENGTVVNESLSLNANEEEDSYSSTHFDATIDDSAIYVKSSDSDFIGSGGTFEIILKVKVDPAATNESFYQSGQVYKINERIVFKNRATVVLDGNEYDSNMTKTNIPLDFMLGIEKNVTGNLGDLTKEFEYTLELSGLKPKKRYTYENSAYVQVSAEYDSDGKLTLEAKTEEGDPVSGVTIKLYSLVPQELPDENSNEQNNDPVEDKYELYAQRKTDSDGMASFTLKPGEYKYEYSYDGETVEGDFVAEYDNDKEKYSVEEIEEIFIARNNYNSEKYFLTDENGNATIKFKLKDDESISFANLPNGVKYKITEAASNHIPSYEVTRGPEELESRSDALEVKEEPLATPEETLTESTEYKFTNHRELESITSSTTVRIFILLIFLVSSLIIFFTRRRKKELIDHSIF